MVQSDHSHNKEIASNEPILVGILSDTHGVLTEHAYSALADCDHLIHAGDIGNPKILRTLETLAPVTAVLGNNDFNEYGEEVRRFAYPVIGGVRFLVSHYPQDVRIGWNGGPGLSAGDPIPHICVHGHTHVPRLVTGKQAKPALYVICPGSVSIPRNGTKASIAKILVAEGQIQDVRLEEL